MSEEGAASRGSLGPSDAAFVAIVTDLLRRGHSVRFHAKGGSMHPTIREGEAITVAPVEPTAIRRGDVILRRSGRGVLAHRVVRVRHDPNRTLAFVTRGDASIGRDDPAIASAVLGRVTAVERGGRTVDPTVAPPWGLAIGRAVAGRILRWLRARLSGS